MKMFVTCEDVLWAYLLFGIPALAVPIVWELGGALGFLPTKTVLDMWGLIGYNLIVHTVQFSWIVLFLWRHYKSK